ncbi:hypothetical protein GCM10025782_23730 [Pedococcus ginsenosidimutans]|jgi:Flp pilus assembly protein TadG|uniref:Putative Flp pilus-assembly TadG-like N-terminal domain-containing protein n=1 Tax=Pedococcus ginsenosidimutans TaxID=490570 RepID=A0ABP8YBD5_9MICO
MVLNPRAVLARARRDEQGAVTVVVALMMIVLVMCAALVVDLGNAKDMRRQSQNASDASALAAANMLIPISNNCTVASGQTPPCFKDAVDAAKSFAASNFNVASTDWDSCTDASALTYVPTGSTPCISFDNASSPTTVRVKAPTKNIGTFFGGVTGNQTIAVGSLAHATVAKTVKCSLCFLGNVDAGNGDFSVSGGAIAVNGNVATGPQSYWTSVSNGVVGTVSGAVHPTPPFVQIPAFGDPLAGQIALPLALPVQTPKTDPCTQGPGIYGDVTLNNGPCPLLPGLYYVTGTWGAKNNTVLTSPTGGVTLYAMSPNGLLDLKNGLVNITPMTTGPTAGFSIVYDPTNTNVLTLQGNGLTSITGKVYAPSSVLDFNGGSCFGFSGGPIVLGGATTNGTTSCVVVNNAVDATVYRGKESLTR